MSNDERVAVMGSVRGAPAFAMVFCDAGNDVTALGPPARTRRQDQPEHRNPDYFPTIALPESLRAVSDPDEAMAGADFVVLAVPSQSLRSNLALWRTLTVGRIVVSLAKGIEVGTGLRMSEVIGRPPQYRAEPDRGGDRSESGSGDRRAAAVGQRGGQRLCRRSALQGVCHTPGSGRTRTLTLSAANWAAPPRT